MIKNFFRNPLGLFLVKIMVCYIVLMLLLYFFGYAGHGQSHFIYNEF